MSARFVQVYQSLSQIPTNPFHMPIACVANQFWMRTPSGELLHVAGEDVGKVYYVYGNTGSDSNNGKSRATPFRTMAAAFDVLASGDTIVLRENIREQLDTPAGVFGVRIVGDGWNTRHPDAHTTNGGYFGARWNAPASPTAATPLLNLRQQGWLVENILFTGSSADTVDCVQLYRDGGAGDAERDASHAIVRGCRFQGGRYGIVDSGGCARIVIKGCEFLLFSNSGDVAIKNVTGAGIGTLWGWDIGGSPADKNIFRANESDIVAALTNASIKYNEHDFVSLGVTNTTAINLTGGSRNKLRFNDLGVAEDDAQAARITLGTGDVAGPNYWATAAEEYLLGQA